MTPVVFGLIGLGLIVLQTAIFPLFEMLAGCYDLLVPLVVFLGLLRRLSHSLPVVIGLGLMVDNLSGAPPGYCLTAYLWIWALVRWLIGFFRVAGTFLLPLTMAGGVVVENLVLLVIPLVLSGGGRPAGPAVETVLWQTVWALGTGPVLVLVFTAVQRCLKKYQERIEARRAVQE